MSDALERVAEDVWLLRGWSPPVMNVYLIEDGGRVTLFDAGVREMADDIARAADARGGLERVVLGHSHSDHRGAAAALGAPILCHPDEVADAEGDGGERYFDYSLLEPRVRRWLAQTARDWDGGPVTIAGTLGEGERVAGFEVVHLPGHAPGLIALWREADRLALTSDAFYTLDFATAEAMPPHLPEAAFNEDGDEARRSLLKLAALEPAAAWPGHADPLTGDVRSALEEAARAAG